MIRSLRTVMAATLLIAGATVSIAGPAEAEPPDCYIISAHSEQAGGHVTGYRYWYCEDEFTPLSVSVYKFLQDGVWEEVATGVGSATYPCDGSYYNLFRTTGTAQFAVVCG